MAASSRAVYKHMQSWHVIIEACLWLFLPSLIQVNFAQNASCPQCHQWFVLIPMQITLHFSQFCTTLQIQLPYGLRVAVVYCSIDCPIHLQFVNTLRRRQMAAIFQTTFANAFYWKKMYNFRLRFHWKLFPEVQLLTFEHWFSWWLGAGQASSHYLNQWWLVHGRIYASRGPNELTKKKGVDKRRFLKLVFTNNFAGISYNATTRGIMIQIRRNNFHPTFCAVLLTWINFKHDMEK